MENKISKETELDLLKLGLYQIGGGVIGILIIAWGIYKNHLFTALTAVLYIIVLLFFAYSIFCGDLCLKPKNNALKHSLINQVLQLFGFWIGGFAFKYVAGFYFTLCLELTNKIDFSLGIGISKFILNLNIDPRICEIDLNLISLGIICWIISLIKKVKMEAEIRTEIEIGVV